MQPTQIAAHILPAQSGDGRNHPGTASEHAEKRDVHVEVCGNAASVDCRI